MLRIASEDTKTHQPIERPWPAALADHLDVYLSVHRLYLKAVNGRRSKLVGEALWVSSRGSAMSHDALYGAVRGRCIAGLGKAINPHLFRDAAATTLAV